MVRNESIPIMGELEFINLQPLDYSPTISECDIKVLYVGANRNGSFISKESAVELSKSLRGTPICGWWREQDQDFGDHGERITIDKDGFKMECLTTPIGFVPLDAKMWFQNFEDYDVAGNPVTREYLMTTGCLWTSQYESARSIIEQGGKGQSMELNSDSLEGHWTTLNNQEGEFFIIDRGSFDKLCVLGDDVEPCFEGASVTAPDVSLTFAKKAENNFKQTLFTMIQELQHALEGGTEFQMDEKEKEILETQDNFELENTEEIQEDTETTTEETAPATEEVAEAEVVESVETEFEEKEDKEEEKEEAESETEDEVEEEDKDDEKYQLLQKEHEDLQTAYSLLEKEVEELRAFKLKVEDAEKDSLIQKFHMLTDEDKKDVVDNKANYSLSDIESKLSVIYTKKQLAAEQEKPQVEESITFTLDNAGAAIPDWVKAVHDTEEELNN